MNWKPCPSPTGFGTMNRLRPRWASDLSGSVRASSISTLARAPNVHHVLTPLITYPSAPSGPAAGVAVTLSPATSLPKSGSVTATAAITSAVASLGSHSSFCSSVPPLTRARVRISGRVISEPPIPRLALLSSSVAMTMAMYSLSPPSEKPPYSAGTESPNAPISARPPMTSSGTSPFVRWTCSACGATTFAANERNVSCTISMSGSRWRGPGVSASDATKFGSR